MIADGSIALLAVSEVFEGATDGLVARLVGGESFEDLLVGGIGRGVGTGGAEESGAEAENEGGADD
jgi:hypothetical protein